MVGGDIGGTCREVEKKLIGSEQNGKGEKSREEERKNKLATTQVPG